MCNKAVDVCPPALNLFLIGLFQKMTRKVDDDLFPDNNIGFVNKNYNYVLVIKWVFLVQILTMLINNNMSDNMA